MLRIQRSEDAELVVLTLSGRFREEDAGKTATPARPGARTPPHPELTDVNLVDGDVVAFLARREANGIRLGNYPDCIRERFLGGPDEIAVRKP